MARTSGHGNPAWTRDETVLALDLYFDLDGDIPSPADSRIQELSALLRSMPYHAEAARKPSFRNPDGVGFKLQNIRQVATGKGLGNVSQMDRSVWAEFGEAPGAAKQLATAIRAGMRQPDLHDDEDEDEFSEGKLLTQL